MKQNGGIIPSFVDLDGRIGGPEGKWWNNAYGWGFSPVNPVTGRREDRNRIPRALVGFSNALLVSGDRKYVDAWRAMIDAVNSHAREAEGRRQYPTMYGADGWYGWRNTPWNVGALEVWYWSQKPQDLARVVPEGSSTTLGTGGWVEFLQGRNPDYRGAGAGTRSEDGPAAAWTALRRDTTPPERRLADNMLDFNPASTESLVQLMWGALLPGREGGLLERSPPLFRSRSETGRRARGCGRARLGTLGHPHGRDARQPQRIATSNASSCRAAVTASINWSA